MEPLVVAGALAGGVGLAGLAVFAAWRYSRSAKPRAETVDMEILHDDHATYIPPAPAARPAPAPPSPSSPRPAPSPVPARAAPPPVPARAAPPPPPPSPRAHAERAPAMMLTQGVAMQDESFSRRPAPRPMAPPAPPRRPPQMKSWAQEVRETMQPEVPTEWARRQVGPVEKGRVAGACGGCGARLSVTDSRPLRIACPVCGRTKLIA